MECEGIEDTVIISIGFRVWGCDEKYFKFDLMLVGYFCKDLVNCIIYIGKFYVV